MQLSCSTLITINVDNVETISNVYWSDSIFFRVRCGANWALKSLMFSYFLQNPISPHVRESGFLNPESGIFCLWNLDSRAQLFEGQLVFNPSFFSCVQKHFLGYNFLCYS